jgi:hypothetical protein
MRYLLFGALVLLFVGCGQLAQWKPSEFDNVEFNSLATLHVLANTPASEEEWCNRRELFAMKRMSLRLQVYSEHRLNDNIGDIYRELNSLINELYDRETPSNVYCKVKRMTVAESIDHMLEVFGGRK